MAYHRIKQNFTAGEISPEALMRTDFDRWVNGCHRLRNMVVETLGAASRRPGTRFIYDLEDVGLTTTNTKARLIPFIFNETQAYVLVFFQTSSGVPRVVFATGEGLVTDSGSVVYLDLSSDFDVEAFDYAQSADVLYIAQAGKQVTKISRTSHTVWTYAAVTFTSQPADWSTPNGWPETVTLHQQRLLFGANTLRRQTIWCSKAGSFENFSVSSPVLDSDAITFTLDSGTQNKIMWMASNKVLSVGTLGNEWVITGNGQTSLTPSSVLAQKQTNNGSQKIKPLQIESTTLFIERIGRAVNEFVYDYTYDSYKSTDVLVLTPHLVYDYSITGWAYQQVPHGIIWCTRDDGNLIGLTYQRQHKVIGWHVHNTGASGYFHSVCSIPGDDREDDVWLIIRRHISGSFKYYLEKFWPRSTGELSEDYRHLDCSSLYQGAPADEISGLDHLEGETVSILADGYVHPDIVVESGAITLRRDASTVLVGLPFVSEVRPLLPDVDLDSGTAFGRRQRIVEVDVFLLRSLGFSIGVSNSESGETDEIVPFRKQTDLLGSAPELFTGIKKVPFLEGWDDKSELYIRQSQPLPLTVVGLVDTVEVTS